MRQKQVIAHQEIKGFKLIGCQIQPFAQLPNHVSAPFSMVVTKALADIM